MSTAIETEKFLRPEEVCRYLSVSNRNLVRWADDGKIKCIRTQGGHRRFPIEEIQRLGGKMSEKKTGEEKVCYCRVSSSGQKKDLDNQVEYLRGKYPNHRIVKDIGSGLSFTRRGFRSLLVKAIEGNISEIVVTHKDRLCRFGFEIIQEVLSHHGGKIVVLDRENTSPEKELVDDLISIITSFSSRFPGLRSGKIRRAITEGIKDKEPKVQDLSE